MGFLYQDEGLQWGPPLIMENELGREPKNEFERRRLLKTVPELKKKLIGQKVRFYGTVSFYEGSKDANGAICAGMGGNTDKQIEVCRAPYDFKRQQFQFEIRAGANFHWPLSLKSEKPRIVSDRMVFKEKYEIGTWGGKKLKVNTFEEDIEYMNGSRFAFKYKVPEAEAEQLIKNMRLKVDLVYELKGLGFHKKCQRSCSVILGQRVCGSDNIGWRPDYGTTFSYHKAKIVDFSVKLAGKEIYGVHRMSNQDAKPPKPEGVVKSIDFAPGARIEDGKVVGKASVVYHRGSSDRTYPDVPFTLGGIGNTASLKHLSFGETALKITYVNPKTMKAVSRIPVKKDVTSHLTR